MAFRLIQQTYKAGILFYVMKFGKILGKSWEEYKVNFRAIFKLILIFVGIPLLILNLVQLILLFSNSDFYQLMTSSPNPNILLSPFLWVMVGLSVLLGLIVFLFQLFAQAGLIGSSLDKSKFSYKEIVTAGRGFFLKFLGFSIVAGLFLLGLFLLLIIPGIIFGVYWMFAVYVLYYEKKGILASLKRSREIVKGKWWRTFGYAILFSLIMLLVSWAGGLITMPTSAIYNSLIISGQPISEIFLGFHYLLGFISGFAVSLIQIPLSVLFFKNFYLEMKKSRK